MKRGEQERKKLVEKKRGVSDGLLQVLGHSVRVKTQEVQGYQLQGTEHHVGVPVY